MSDTSAGKVIALARSVAKVNKADVTEAVDAWLDENITNPDSPPLDRDLSSSSAAAPADMVGDLKSAFNLLAVVNVNLFDKTTATIGKILSEGSVVDSTYGFYSDYIAVTPGDYLVPMGASTGNTAIELYTSEKTYAGEGAPANLGNGLLKYTISSSIVKFVRFNNDKRAINEIMFVKGTEYPNVYMPYQSARLKNDIPLSEIQQEYVDGVEGKIIADTNNLFNWDSSDLLNGYFTSGSFVSNNSYRMTHPIFVEKNVEYVYPQSPALGSNYSVAKLDSDYNIIGAFVLGTNDNGIITFANDADGYVSLNIGYTTSVRNFYCIKKSDYLGKYEPYGDILKEKIYPSSHFMTPNLFNKKVVFDGDSICYGAQDTTGRGYASRIGNANEMAWANVGVSGGTIAVVPGVSHNLCTYIDTIHTNYPELDYLILEGGTNDSDHLGESGLGTLTAANDFSGSYNTATFYGALETLFYKAINYYPSTKIGYVIPPKMAIWTSSGFVFNANRNTFLNAVKLACAKWGIRFFDLWNESVLNPCMEVYFDRTMTAEQNLAAGKMYGDQQHPNDNGYDFIYSSVANWMNAL